MPEKFKPLIGEKKMNEKLEGLRGRSIIEIGDLKSSEIRALTQRTYIDKIENRIPKPVLDKRNVAWLSSKNSTRTEFSLVRSTTELGGVLHKIDYNTSQISRGEPVQDTVGVMNQMRYAALAIRDSDHSLIESYRDFANFPVFNALSGLEHPLQALADIQTLFETFGYLKDLNVAFCGEINNVSRSLLLICLSQGVNVSIACPNVDQLDEETRLKAEVLALKHSCTFKITNGARDAVEAADVVYTDVWFSMGNNVDGEEKEALIKVYQPYQVNTELMSFANQDAIVLHCLPAHRGEEITEEIMSVHGNKIYEQAGNRFHNLRTLLEFTC
jgi:ornithine carbamoyltransferase